MSTLTDNLDMSYLQDIAANWDSRAMAKAIEEAMFAYIYSQLNDGKEEIAITNICYLRMLRDAFLDVKPKG